MKAVDKIIATAEAELGYLEKRSNSGLDDKTANAGSNNFTKYNRDLKTWTGVGSIDAQWCQAFVDWVFIKALGLDAAKRLIYVWTNYTPTGSGAFKQRNRYIKRGSGKPKRGDIIYFYSSSKGRIGHVGIVYKVSGNTVYTIEGNTSNASALVTNGGGVKRKSYSMTSTYIDGYGSVDYSVLDGVDFDAPENPVTKLGDRVLYNFVEGDDVKELQQTLIGLSFDCGSYGADGEYGDCTEMAVCAFQQSRNLPVTGRYDAATHAALTAAVTEQESGQGGQGGQGNQGSGEVPKPKYVEIQKGVQCYIRTEANTSAEKLGVAHSGDRLPYLGITYDNGWYAVEHKGRTACVSGKYSRLVE